MSGGRATDPSRRQFLHTAGLAAMGATLGTPEASDAGAHGGQDVAAPASLFAVTFEDGAIISLRYAGDTVDTEYVAPGARLGDVILPLPAGERGMAGARDRGGGAPPYRDGECRRLGAAHQGDRHARIGRTGARCPLHGRGTLDRMVHPGPESDRSSPRHRGPRDPPPHQPQPPNQRRGEPVAAGAQAQPRRGARFVSRMDTRQQRGAVPDDHPRRAHQPRILGIAGRLPGVHPLRSGGGSGRGARMRLAATQHAADTRTGRPAVILVFHALGGRLRSRPEHSGRAGPGRCARGARHDRSHGSPGPIRVALEGADPRGGRGIPGGDRPSPRGAERRRRDL